MSDVLSPQIGDAFVLCGGSGSGKGTIVAEAMPLLEAQHPDMYLSRSYTTRERRPDEPEDAYRFVSLEHFERALDEGRLLEWTCFNGTYYGTPCPVSGKIPFIEIEVSGASEAMKSPLLRRVHCAFILPLNPLEQVVQLLARRDMMNRAKKVDRFATFVTRELAAIEDLNAHVIVNDEVSRATTRLINWVNGDRTQDERLEEVIAKHRKYAPKLLELMQELYPTQA